MSERVRHRVDSADWSAVPHPHVIELVRQGCAEDPERPAIILEDGLIVTRRELLDRSQRFAGYLRSRLKPGDRVVVMLDNRVEFMIALFAIMANRAILVSTHDEPFARRWSSVVLRVDDGRVIVDR